MQRRFMYFPTAGVPTPVKSVWSGVEPVTFETSDGLGLAAWFFAASGPSPRVTVLVFTETPAIEPTGALGQQRSIGTDCSSARRYRAMAEIRAPSENGLAWTAGRPRRTLTGRSDVVGRGSCTSANRSEQHGCQPRRRTPPGGACPAIAVTSMGVWESITIRFLPGGSSSPRPVCSDRSIQRIECHCLSSAGGHDRIRADREYSPPVPMLRWLPKTLLVLPDVDHNDTSCLRERR